ncbi:MAG: hypothetical protein LBL66_05925 [Clostridiales bacterium]|jgi:hypothetical protein|nr:hypothetical protein [Clostridiales bacterium]
MKRKGLTAFWSGILCGVLFVGGAVGVYAAWTGIRSRTTEIKMGGGGESLTTLTVNHEGAADGLVPYDQNAETGTRMISRTYTVTVGEDMPKYEIVLSATGTLSGKLYYKFRMEGENDIATPAYNVSLDQLIADDWKPIEGTVTILQFGQGNATYYLGVILVSGDYNDAKATNVSFTVAIVPG